MTSLHPTRLSSDGTPVADVGDIVDIIQIQDNIKKNGEPTLEDLPQLMKILSHDFEMKLPTKAHLEKLISILTKIKDSM